MPKATHRRNAPRRDSTKRASPKRKSSKRPKPHSHSRKLSPARHSRSTKGLKKKKSKAYIPHKRSGGAPHRSANDYKVGQVKSNHGRLYRVVSARKGRKRYNRWVACPKGLSAKQCRRSSKRNKSKSKKKKSKGKKKKSKLHGGDAAIARRLKLALFGGSMRLPSGFDSDLVGG